MVQGLGFRVSGLGFRVWNHFGFWSRIEVVCKRTPMGTLNREPQDYSKNKIGICIPGCLHISTKLQNTFLDLPVWDPR